MEKNKTGLYGLYIVYGFPAETIYKGGFQVN